MTAEALIDQLQRRGVEFQVAGTVLRFRPRELVTDDERALLRQHKAEVLSMLLAANLSGAMPTPAARPRAELARVLGLPLDRLDRVLCVRVPWLDGPLWFVPAERDADDLVAAGEATRGAVWTARELLDILAIPGLTSAHVRTVALAKVEFGGDVVAVRPRQDGA